MSSGTVSPEKYLQGILDVIGKDILEINTKNGWEISKPEDWDEKYKIPAKLMLITTEVSEATEAFRHNDMENFKEELADIAIRLLDLSAGMGISLGEEISKKMNKNRMREFRHGGKKI